MVREGVEVEGRGHAPYLIVHNLEVLAAAEFAPARSTTATVTDPGGLAVQLVRYEPDSPDR